MRKTLPIFLGCISFLGAQSLPTVKLTPYQEAPDMVLSTGGSFNYFNHSASSLSTFQVKTFPLNNAPVFSSTSVVFVPSRNPDGSLSANSFTVKSGFTYVPLNKGIFHLWINSEIGITKFDFATLRNFDGAVGLAIDIGKSVTKGKYHVYVMPFMREVSIASLQIKPDFGLQFGTGLSKVAGQ